METRVAVIAVIVENEDAVGGAERAAASVRRIYHWADGVPYRARGVNIISVVLDAAAGTADLRPQREDREAGGCQCQDAVLQRDHTDRRQIGMLHDSFV